MSNTKNNKVFLSPNKILIIIAIAFGTIKLYSFFNRISPSNSKQSIYFDSKIGISKEKWLYDADTIGWKKLCLDLWDKKETGVLGNINDLGDYITQCPKDAEAGIYYNNFQAREKVEKSTNSKTIKVATSIPISRKNGVFNSIEVLKGVELAQRRINQAGGINVDGQTIFLEVGIVDEGWNLSSMEGIENWSNKTDKEKETTISKLVATAAISSNVIATIGHFSSDAIEAAAPIYDGKLIAISPSSTAVRQLNDASQSLNFIDRWLKADKLRDKHKPLDLNDYIFRTAPNDADAISRLKTKYIDLNSKDIERIIVVYDESSRYSLLYKKELKKQLNKKIVNEENCGLQFSRQGNLDPMEIHNCANNIAQNNPDALILVLSTANVSELKSSFNQDGRDTNFFQIVREKAGYLPQLIGSDSLYNEQYLDEGTIVSVAMEKKRQPFPKAIENPHKEYETIEVNWLMSTAYDAVIAIAQGVANSTKCARDRSISQCRQQLQKSLSSEEFVADGMLGNNSIKFDSGDRQVLEDNNSLAVVLIVKNHNFVDIGIDSSQ